MSETSVLRTEYEQFVKTYEVRHAELRLEIKESESELKASIGQLNLKIDQLSTQVSQRGNDVWKLLSTSFASLIAGYLLSYLQHLLGR